MATTFSSISQPSDWAWHSHIQKGRPDLTEGLREMRIPHPLSDLRKTPFDDYFPFEQAPAQLTSIHPNYRVSEQRVRFSLKPSPTSYTPSIVLQWIGQRWIALRQQREKCPYCNFEGERYIEAYALDEYCAKKILEAYSIHESIISVEEVSRTSPSDLALIAEYRSRFIEITYARGYYEHYDPFPSASVKIPVGGKLPQIPEYVRQGYMEQVEVSRAPMEELKRTSDLLAYPPFTEVSDYAMGNVTFAVNDGSHHLMQLRWVKERNEWVVIAYGMESGGGFDHSEWYSGPFALDDYCFERLMQAYGLSSKKLTLQECVRTEPYKLGRIALQ